MYRIEVAPGEESVFRTIEELAVGIRNGVVTPRARIFHHASEKWLPIGLHPHYKKALAMPAASASHAPVTSATPTPTPSRPKAHSPSHPKPQSVVHYPEPRAPEPTAEPGPEPKAAAAPRIPAPVQSPVIAMQNEVLRDLPVISIPEPLPWQVKPSHFDAPTVKTYVPAEDTPVRQAPMTPAPTIPAPVTHAPVTPAPATHAPVIHAPVSHAPMSHAPVTHAPVIHAPRTHAPRTHAPVIHPPVTHAPIPHAPAPHAPAPHAPAPRAPEPYRPEPYRSMENRPPVEDRRGPDADELPFSRPTARRSRRMTGRPLLLLGAAAALVVGTHLVLTATPSASVDPSEGPAATAIEEPGHPDAGTSSAETRVNETRVNETRVTGAPRVTSAPARASMTPGPAFTGSVPARPGADSAGAPKATTNVPAAAPKPADPSIAPAPASIELAIPGLPPESVVPTARTGDTTGMKKILRALNGSKPAEGSAAP